MTAPSGPRVGRSVVRVDPSDWSMHPFVQGQLERPIDVRFNSSGHILYLLDFGHFEMLDGAGIEASAHSGRLWAYRLTER